jgi:hypothetical protein
VTTGKIGADYRRNPGRRKQRGDRRGRAVARRVGALSTSTPVSQFPLVFLFCSAIVTPLNIAKEGVMKSAFSKSVISKSVISATILAFVIGTGAAFAQAPAAPTVPATPAAATAEAPADAPAAAAKTTKPKLSPDEKKKISQECSAQANDKKLHGKDRQKFRATCIRHGGAAA